MGGVRVGGNSCCLQSQFHAHAGGGSPFSSSSSPPQTLSSLIFSSSNKTIQRRRGGGGMEDRTLITYSFAHRSDQRRPRSPFLGTSSPNLPRGRSLDDFNWIAARRSHQQRQVLLRRASSASLEDDDDNSSSSFFTTDDDDDDDEEEHVRLLGGLALNHSDILPDSRNDIRQPLTDRSTTISFSPFSVEPPWSAIEPGQPNWADGYEMVAASVEMKANSVELPLSLRIIKRKKQRQRSEEGRSTVNEAGDSACCAARKAFSSMVFMVRELHSYTLQMREVLCYENLQGILCRVQGEMNASFVWLFQHIFSCTPTLMVCLMLLLANFTVYSVGLNSSSMAAVPPNNVPATRPAAEIERDHLLAPVQRFDPCSISSGRAASIGGGGSGGGGARPVAGATDDGGRSSSHLSHAITLDVHGGGDESEAGAVTEEEGMVVWNRIKEEGARMQASSRDGTLMDPDVLQQLVSPVKAELEPEDESEYWKTELMYHQALSQDADNAMVLCNFAQFIYLVRHDHNRAECYFQRAAQVKPADAEALNQYANFLWLAKNDLGAAEEAYLEAIAADPSNSYYAANYAHFLWNTGGDDTCYPLDNADHACN